MAAKDQDQNVDSKKFTEKQKAFVREYLIDFHVTKAAQRAGYSEKSAHSQGSDLLKLPKIRKAITDLQEETSQSWIVNKNWVLSQYLHVYDKCSQREEVMEWDNDTKSLKPTGEWKFDSNGALKALDKLAMHTGFAQGDNKPDSDKIEALEITIKGASKSLNIEE